MVKHEESLNAMVQFIWRWIVGNGGHHFFKGRVGFNGDSVLYSGAMVLEVRTRV